MWSLCKQANQHSDPSRTFLSETSKKQFQALKRPATHIPRLLSFLCLAQENPGLLPACWMLLYRPEGRLGSGGGQCFGQNKGCHHDPSWVSIYHTVLTERDPSSHPLSLPLPQLVLRVPGLPIPNHRQFPSCWEYSPGSVPDTRFCSCPHTIS